MAEAARDCALLGQNPNDYFIRDTVAEEINYTLDSLGFVGKERDDLRGTSTNWIFAACSGAIRATSPAASGRAWHSPPSRAASPRCWCWTSRRAAWTRRTSARSPPCCGDGPAAAAASLLVTHDVEFAARTADRVVVLGNGGVLADGAVHAVLHGSLFFSTQVNRLFRHTLPGC